MARSFDELRNRMSDERQLRARLAAQQAMADLLMDEVRVWLGLGEPDAASRTVAELRRLVEALDGELEIVIRLPKGVVRLS